MNLPDEPEPSGPNVDLRLRPRHAAEVFDDWDREGRMERMAEGHMATAGGVLDAIRIGPCGTFLDIGCGVGAAAARLKARRPDATVVAFDKAPRLARKAAQRVDHAFRADAVHIPLRDSSVDAAFSMEVLYYLREPQLALREIARLLVPGGTFDLLIDFYEENPYSADWPELVGVHMTRWSKPQWVDAFRLAGFAKVEAIQVRPEPDVVRHQAYDDPDYDEWARRYGSLHVNGRRRSKEPSAAA